MHKTPIAALILAVASLLTFVAPTAGSGEVGSDVTREETLGRWPGVSPTVCLQDETDGFPVREAAADFHDLPVTFVVEDDCSGYGNVVRVRTRIAEDCCYSGWFRSERADGHPDLYESATIWLHLDQAFRHTPETWASTLRHEIGHAAGLGHAEGTSLMHPTRSREVQHLTEGDREAIADIYEGEMH